MGTYASIVSTGKPRAPSPPYPSEKGSSYLVRSGKQGDKVSGQKVQGKCHHVESQMMN